MNIRKQLRDRLQINEEKIKSTKVASYCYEIFHIVVILSSIVVK